MEGQLKEDPRPCASPMGFPVTALLGPAGPLLRQLSSLSNSNMWEGTISWEEIRKLKEDLEKLCISLMHQSEAEEPLSSTAKLWMSEIRELCYDTKMYLDHAQCSPTQDDDYDDDDTQLTTKEKQETEEKLEEEKQEIARLKFKALQDRANRAKVYGIAEPSTRKPQLPSMGRRLPVLHPELIDRGRMDNLAALLGNAQEKELKVVSLVGLEGVGKTTLAKRIYHTTGGQFVCRAFVRVSPNPDMRRLLTTIFRQIQSPGFSFYEGVSQPACCLDAQALITNIQKHLQDKRYFIIIDDLWSASVWDVIRPAFPDGGCHSRIITTTQFTNVASACCSYQSKCIFEMQPLKYDQSRKLFFGMVFGSENEVRISEGIREVSSDIIEKCGGLPLSILNIASLLLTKESETNSKPWMDVRNCLPCSLRRNPTSEGVKEILHLIYNNLSPEQKTCLLYLVVYPEGYTLNKDDLIKQWVIEGLIGEGENQEEIAGQYFDELVSRGMIQAVDINYRGVVSCIVHHTVHDIIVNKSIEKNFIIRVDYFQSAIGLIGKVRRLSVQFGAARSARKPEGIMMSEVQSLAFFGFYGCMDFMEDCKLLGVLILHVWADQDKVPFDLSGICNLLVLRYLKITCQITVTLPDEIVLLQHLEMLDVGATIVAIPPGIQYLNKLSSINIAVQALSEEDICILKRMYALTTLSVDVKTTPTKWIVFGKGGFLVLSFFTFRCSAPRVRIEMNAMPIIKKLNLCFNAHIRKYRKKPITIEHMASLQEISVEILGAVSVKGSALTNVVTNNEKNPIPIVLLIESREDKEYEIMEEDYYSGKYEEEEACSRMASTPTNAKIPAEAAPITTGTIMEPLYLKVGLNSTCETFAEFIDELRRKVAEHPEKAVVHNYGPVLAKKQQQGKPARIIMINLMDDQNKRVELAVRDDNLELVGFKHSPRLWYEFPIEGKSMKLFTSSISVNWETSYVSLLGEAEDELEKLELGRMSAKSALADLDKYHSNSRSEVCADTKKALAKLMVMICESARFAPIFDTVKAGWEKDKGISITKRQVKYIDNWANISRFLLGRRSDAGIDDQADAVRALHLVHNPARPLVELFGVRASPDFSGTISIIDEENYKVTICERYEEGQFNIFNLDSLGRRRSYLHMEMQDLPLDATYRPVSSDGKISIQFDSVYTYDRREDSKQSMSVEANKIHQIEIHNVNFSPGVELKYGVLRDAVPKCLKVQLNLKEHKAHHVLSLHGEITVINNDFVGESVLLFDRTEERAIQCEVTHTSDGLDVISVPLLRHFIAASLDKPLEIEVSLFATSSGYQNPITLKATLQFDPNTNSETKDIGAPGMEAHLMVTATDQETKPISLVSIIARGRSSRASIAQQKSIASQQKKGKESGV